MEDFTTPQGLPISNFRLGCTPRRYDRRSERWVNGDTNWYTVSAFRQLAQNVKSSLSKGDPVVVTGRLRVRQWENDKGQRGTSVEIDAESVGYDLTFGTGSFTRLGTSQVGTESTRAPAESETTGPGSEPEGPSGTEDLGQESQEAAQPAPF
ncbi:hypothetical protein GCM10009672_13040 [Nesterenkonia lutea]